MFRQYTRDAVGNDIGFCVDTAEAVACILVEDESGLEPGEFMAGGARGAALGKPRFSCSVFALEKIDGMGILVHGLHFGAVEVATQHCDEMCGILK